MVTSLRHVALISDQAQTCAAYLEGFYMVPSSACSLYWWGWGSGDSVLQMLQLLHVTTCVAGGPVSSGDNSESENLTG